MVIAITEFIAIWKNDSPINRLFYIYTFILFIVFIPKYFDLYFTVSKIKIHKKDDSIHTSEELLFIICSWFPTLSNYIILNAYLITTLKKMSFKLNLFNWIREWQNVTKNNIFWNMIPIRKYWSLKSKQNLVIFSYVSKVTTLFQNFISAHTLDVAPIII